MELRRGQPAAAPEGRAHVAGALRQLRHFVDTGLPGFGPYEDAVPADTWTVNHSLLSPYLNLGLLDPDEVVNGAYWATGPAYAARNALGADRPLPPAYDDPSLTRIACLRSTVEDVHRRGWVHHIPRLMILADLALTAGAEPRSLLSWMRRMFVDAADWVMVPNVIGMGVHADGSVMMTKPYAAGGAYVNRMTTHGAACPFNPKKRTGSDACPLTTLYWDVLARNADAFARRQPVTAQKSRLPRARSRRVLSLRPVAFME